MAAAINLPAEQLRIPRHLRSRLDGPAGERLSSLRLVDDVRPEPRRPRVEVVDDLAPRPAMRLAPLVVLGCAVIVAVAALLPMLTPSPVTTGNGGAYTDEVVPVVSGTYVVQPGDTLWDIAATLTPEGDPRPLVDALARQLGPTGLQPGQRLQLDGLIG